MNLVNNYYAFAATIFNKDDIERLLGVEVRDNAELKNYKLTPDKALSFMGCLQAGKGQCGRKKVEFTGDEIKEMIEMKATMTYKEIGLIFGCCNATVYRTVKGRREKRKMQQQAKVYESPVRTLNVHIKIKPVPWYKRVSAWYDRNYEDLFLGVGPALIWVISLMVMLTVFSQLAIRFGW